MYGANTTSSNENKGMEGNFFCVFFLEGCIGFCGERFNYFLWDSPSRKGCESIL
jgi:hypothetical protein